MKSFKIVQKCLLNFLIWCLNVSNHVPAGTCTLILGRRFGFLDEEISETATRLADSVTSQFRASQEAFYGLPLWKLMPTKAYKDFIASEEALYEQVQRLNKRQENRPTKRCDFFFSIFLTIPTSVSCPKSSIRRWSMKNSLAWTCAACSFPYCRRLI